MWITVDLISMALDSTTGNTVMWLAHKNNREKRVTIQTENSEGIMPGMSNTNVEMVVNLIKSLSGKFLRGRIYKNDQGDFIGEMVVSGGDNEFGITCSAPFAATVALKFNGMIIVPESMFKEKRDKNTSPEFLKKHLNNLSAIELTDYYF